MRSRRKPGLDVTYSMSLTNLLNIHTKEKNKTLIRCISIKWIKAHYGTFVERWRYRQHYPLYRYDKMEKLSGENSKQAVALAAHNSAS